MLKYTFMVAVVVSVLGAACGGKAKGTTETPAPSASGCDVNGTWEVHFTWQGDAAACGGTSVPWDQPFTVVVTGLSDPGVEEEAQTTPWGSTEVKATQMLGNPAECTVGWVATGYAGDDLINLNIGPLHQTGTTATGEVELNRPVMTDGTDETVGCSRRGTATATKK